MQLIEKEGQVETGQEIRVKDEGVRQFLFQKSYGREEDIPHLFHKFNLLLPKGYPPYDSRPASGYSSTPKSGHSP